MGGCVSAHPGSPEHEVPRQHLALPLPGAWGLWCPTGRLFHDTQMTSRCLSEPPPIASIPRRSVVRQCGAWGCAKRATLSRRAMIVLAITREASRSPGRYVLAIPGEASALAPVLADARHWARAAARRGVRS